MMSASFVMFMCESSIGRANLPNRNILVQECNCLSFVLGFRTNAESKPKKKKPTRVSYKKHKQHFEGKHLRRSPPRTRLSFFY